MIRSLILFLAVTLAALGQVIPGRYIVEFTADPAAAPNAARQTRFRANDPGVAARLTAIRSQHALAERRIAAMNGTVQRRIENVANALVVEIDDTRAAALATLQGVNAIHQDETVRLLLDHAVAVHKIVDAWSTLPNGRDGAGAGIKVGIIDSGIAIEHPGFQDDSLPSLDGYPKTDQSINMAFTNKKVIVARNYSNEGDVRDQNGHGSAVAMAAAGAFHSTPVTQISGVAPKAYLGIYKVGGADGTSTFSAFLAAMDDALADGMDVVNYSSGAAVTTNSALHSVIISAVDKAVGAGMLVAVSAGNSGPTASTIGTPAIAPSAIAVAASGNERVFGSSVSLDDGTSYVASPGNGPVPDTPVAGQVADLKALGMDPLGCDGAPKDSLTGKIALIQRGTCSFAIKVANVAFAGAIGAVVYNNLANATLVRMDVVNATLPAIFISAEDGAALASKIAAKTDTVMTLDFGGFTSFSTSSDRMASFSSAGPTGVVTLKPDITAVGTSFYTATQKTNSNGEMYDASGWTLTQGTSFSSPLVAGAIALLKSAKPGLTASQYRSLIVNSGRPLPLGDTQASPTVAGSGLLDLSRALASTLTAAPTSLDFGAGSGTANGSIDLQVTNIGAATDTFTVTVDTVSGSISPVPSVTTLTLDPAASSKLTLTLNGDSLDPGSYIGFVKLAGTMGATEARIPYWFGSSGKTPASIAILRTGSGSARQTVSGAVVFRIVDAAGLPLEVKPTVIADATSGARVNLVYATGDIPGTYAVDVRFGTANPTFTITAGDITQTVTLGLN